MIAGDRELLLFALDRLGDLLLCGLDRRHRPALGQGAHQAAPGGDQLCRVGEVEDAGDVGGGDLADRVAGEQVGLQASLCQGLMQGDLDREEGRLGVGGVLEQLAAAFLPLAKTISLSGCLQVLVELCADRVEGRCEVRVCLVELLAHAEALGALAGEEVGELAVPCLALTGRGGLAVGESAERGEQLLAVAAQRDRAVLEGACGW